MSKKNRRKAEVSAVEVAAVPAEEVLPSPEFVQGDQTAPEIGLVGDQVVDDEPVEVPVLQELAANVNHSFELLENLVIVGQILVDVNQGVESNLVGAEQVAAIDAATDEANAQRAIEEFAEAAAAAPIPPPEPPCQPTEPVEPTEPSGSSQSVESATVGGTDEVVPLGEAAPAEDGTELTADELKAKIDALQAAINAAKGKRKVASGSRPRPNVKYTLLKKPAAWAGTPQLAQLQKILFSPEVMERFKKEDGQVEMTEPEFFAVIEAGAKAGILRTTQPPVRIAQYYRSQLLNMDCLRWQ